MRLVLKRLAHGFRPLVQDEVELLLVQVSVIWVIFPRPGEGRKLITDPLQNRAQLRNDKLYVSARLLLYRIHILDFVENFVE